MHDEINSKAASPPNPSLARLTSALVKARGEINHPVRNKVNPHFKNRYADLTAVLDAVIPAFTANGLALIQLVEGSQLVTILAHASGESITSTTDLPSFSNPQQLGSALTYLRRYTVQALAAIAADDDDDGNASSPTSKPKEKKESVDGARGAVENRLNADTHNDPDNW